MQHRLTFSSWKLPEGTEPPADQAQVWASLRLAYMLPPSRQAGQPGGADMHSPESFDAALELVHMFRATRNSDDDNTLSFSGASYVLGDSALKLLKGNWRALRSFIGASEAEAIALVEDFLDNIEEYNPNDAE